MPRELTKWSRLPAITSLHDELSRVFDRFFRGWEEPTAEITGWMPPIDLAETADRVMVKAEIPGVNPNDINISIRNNTLLLTGEKKEEREEKGRNFYRMERRYGNFSRSIDLPSSVDPDRITAECKNGVLEIMMEKKEAMRPKQITVKAM
ncbi:MAG: Hsp20/alpha crystallin family protein [wastewater metagenome]|nr:Hsp20/alpha crystallin family protein [Candidatus Loosdrechtia aerotolerans]